MAEKIYPEEVECPNCNANLLLDRNERISGELTCPECGQDIRLYDTIDIENGTVPDEVIDVNIHAEGLGDEINRGIHAAKSYVGLAFLTLLLYYAGFYIIGLICNIVFIAQANESMRISGCNPSGRGCLMVLIWFHLIIPAIILLIFFIVAIVGSVFAAGSY